MSIWEWLSEPKNQTTFEIPWYRVGRIGRRNPAAY